MSDQIQLDVGRRLGPLCHRFAKIGADKADAGGEPLLAGDFHLHRLTVDHHRAAALDA